MLSRRAKRTGGILGLILAGATLVGCGNNQSHSVVIAADCDEKFLTLDSVTVPGTTPITPHIALERSKYTLTFDHYKTPLEKFSFTEKVVEEIDPMTGKQSKKEGIAEYFYRKACETEDIPKAQFLDDKDTTGDPLRSDKNEFDGDMQGSILFEPDITRSERENFMKHSDALLTLEYEPNPEVYNSSSEMPQIVLDKSGSPEFHVDENTLLEKSSYKISLVRDLHVLVSEKKNVNEQRFRDNLKFAKAKNFPSNEWALPKSTVISHKERGYDFR